MNLPIKEYAKGFTFYIVIFLIFLILKFGFIIHWSWLWIFAPLWIPLGITAVALVIFGICWFVVFLFNPQKQKELLKKLIKK
jgi:energy-coupling factor transporter transmembrane protein EcfT